MNDRAVTVGDLVEALKTLRQDAPVLMSSDAEGNNHHTFGEIDKCGPQVEFVSYHSSDEKYVAPVVFYPNHDLLVQKYDEEDPDFA